MAQRPSSKPTGLKYFPIYDVLNANYRYFFLMQFTFPPPLTKPTDTQQYWYSAANFWNPSRFPPTYPPSGSGISRESSRDDLTSMELEHVFDFEERFRVDRRKLELLIMGQYEPIDGTAAEYFQKV